MTGREHLSRHDREIAQIRAIQKRTEQTMAKHAANYARESAEMWLLLGKLAKGTEAAQKETQELRADLGRFKTSMREESQKTWAAIPELTAAQKITEATLKAFIESLRRGSNGHRKR